MNIGKLRRRVTFLAATSSQDPDTGVMTEGAWTPVGEATPASIEPLSAREFVAAAAAQASASHRITVRYRNDLTSQMRCVDDRGQVYSLVGPPLPDRDSGLEYLTLVCLVMEGEAPP